MRFAKLLPLVFIVFVAFGTALSFAEDDSLKYARGLSSAFQKVADSVGDSVVNIRSLKKVTPQMQMRNLSPFLDQFRDFFGEDPDNALPFQPPEGFSQEGLGTGVVVDGKGYVLTNNHVVGDADEVLVRLQNGKEYKAEIVGTDPPTDLAVIKIKAEALVPAKLGDSSDLKIGEWVIAAGNPFGLDHTFTAGIVSAKGRSLGGGAVGANLYQDFIQTDAAINPGNSGGPLLNLEGEVVGINTAIFSRSGGYMGIGFAIPSNMAKSVMQSLIDGGKVVRGWLGVGIQNLNEDLAKSFNYPNTEGALVGHVQEGSPAENAGLKQGDIIVTLDGSKIKDINQLRNTVAGFKPGQVVDIEVVRDGRKTSLSVKISEQPEELAGKAATSTRDTSNDIGIAVDNLTPQLSRQLGTKRSEGVVVAGVASGSVAERAGMQPRDIILSINGKDIKDVNDFKREMKKAELSKGVRLVVETQGMQRFVLLRAE